MMMATSAGYTVLDNLMVFNVWIANNDSNVLFPTKTSYIILFNPLNLKVTKKFYLLFCGKMA